MYKAWWNNGDGFDDGFNWSQRWIILIEKIYGFQKLQSQATTE